MSVNRDRGKRTERAVAQALSGKRIGTMCGEDVMHDNYSIECKSRKQFVAAGWMEQAIRNNKDGKVPMVVVHVHGQRREGDFVILRISDFNKHCYFYSTSEEGGE